MMRLIGQDEMDAEEDMLNVWWNNLSQIEKSHVADLIRNAKDIPEPSRLCLRDYPTQNKDERGNYIYTICLNVKPCSDHG